MKLGEALTERADLIRRLTALESRIASNVLVQEGEEPSEDPQALLDEAERVADQLEELIVSINRTNAETTLEDGRTVTAALAERDVLGTRVRTLQRAISSATQGVHRYSLTEIKYERKVDITDLQSKHDDLAKRRRELDTEIQAHNWTTDLV